MPLYLVQPMSYMTSSAAAPPPGMVPVGAPAEPASSAAAAGLGTPGPPARRRHEHLAATLPRWPGAGLALLLLCLLAPLGRCALGEDSPLQPNRLPSAVGEAPAPAPAGSAAAVAADQAGSDHRIGTGDLLRIEIFNHPELTTTIRISTSGAVSFPLIGDLPAVSGQTVEQLGHDIKTR